MKRREFLRASAAMSGVMLLATNRAGAAPDDISVAAPVEFEAGKAVPTLDELLKQAMSEKGTATPYTSEVKKAQEILGKCPTRQNPMQIAQFFEDLRQGAMDQTLGADAHLYAEEWPVRANPAIVTFFDATTLRKPNGDQTAWCAAFVNWCLVQGRKDREDVDKLLKHTASAASESFRSWGTATTDPKPGDIVVFQHKSESWRGHVGFFVSRVKDSIYILGGNQMPLRARLPDGTYERRNTGEVNVSHLPVSGADLKLHSYRTDPSLHDL